MYGAFAVSCGVWPKKCFTKIITKRSVFHQKETVAFFILGIDKMGIDKKMPFVYNKSEIRE